MIKLLEIYANTLLIKVYQVRLFPILSILQFSPPSLRYKVYLRTYVFRITLKASRRTGPPS